MDGPQRLNRYERKLSPMERMCVFCDDLYPPFVSQMVLEGEGEFDIAAWENAIKRGSDVNPGSRLVLRRYLGWSRWVDSFDLVKVHLIDGENWNGTGPEGASFLKRRLPARSGPTCEILLLTGSPKRVILRAHHGVTDGGGGLRFLDELFRNLRGEPGLGTLGSSTDTEMAKKIGRGKIKLERDNCQSPWPPTDTDVFVPGTTWRRITIPGRHSKTLARISLVVAQKAHEMKRQTQAQAISHGRRPAEPSVVRLNIPTDMRKSCPDEPPSSANLTGMITIDVAETDTLTDIISAIGAELEGRREGMMIDSLKPLRWVPGWLLKSYWYRRTLRAFKNARFPTSGSVTNLGVLPVHQYQGGGFKAKTAFGVPPGNDGLPLLIVFNSTGEQLEIIATAPNSLATGAQLEILLSDIRDALLKN